MRNAIEYTRGCFFLTLIQTKTLGLSTISSGAYNPGIVSSKYEIKTELRRCAVIDSKRGKTFKKTIPSNNLHQIHSDITIREQKIFFSFIQTKWRSIVQNWCQDTPPRKYHVVC